MTKSEAEQYIRGEKSFDEISNSQADNIESQNSLGENTSSSTSVSNGEKSTSEDNEPVETNDVTSADVANLEKVDKSEKKTKEDRVKHAFAKERNRRREIQATLDAKLREIEDLKANLEKYKGLTRDNFKGDDDAYTDYKVDQRLNMERVNNLQKEYDNLSMEEATVIAETRMHNNFPDENDRSQYQQLVMMAENNYAKIHPEIGYNSFSDFLMSEKDHTVLNFLQDSDISPKLIRHFIYKPEAAMRIMSMHNQYNKVVELKQLENRLIQHERIKNSKPIVEKKIPNTGKVIQTNTMANAFDWSRPISKAEAEQYLRNKR